MKEFATLALEVALALGAYSVGLYVVLALRVGLTA
jgi:hypothetical protein